MAGLTLELPSQKMQTAFNLRRWTEVLDDPELARVEGRIETDRHGNIIMSPPPAPDHGSYQVEISYLLRSFTSEGRVITEAPISTADGVRAADVAWASPARMAELGSKVCFTRAPEICIEVLSPRNSKREVQEKLQLYFDAGAEEVWVCSQAGAMSFYTSPGGPATRASKLFSSFPKQIRLR